MEAILQLIPMREVQRMSGLSRTEINRRIRAGRFPRPCRLSDDELRAGSRWELGEVQAWVKARLAERTAKVERASAVPQPLAA